MIADDQTRAKIYRLLSWKSFVSERDDFAINTRDDCGRAWLSRYIVLAFGSRNLGSTLGRGKSFS